ncbi:MAG TPA: ABC transporter ATP-binding protein [Sedimentisphaerales bacterium]|nr:ABC transporter ATP-binding protein [Sedimentisphaerales bacterium]
MEYAIETFSLTKVFSDWWGRDKVYAVNDLNLQIRYNEVFGLLGPNGSGKTTTLKMLLGLLYPTKGRAVILGGDSTDPKISSRIGFLPEESYLYSYLSARETLDFYGRLFGLAGKVRRMRIEALLDMVGLRGVANRLVGTFSKGMARRIGLAQALINDPDLLILDEPTTGLDPIGTRQIKDLILQLAKRGKTILLCSHLLADVEDVCDRIAILYGGKIQSAGRVRDLLVQSGKLQITTDGLSGGAVDKIKQIIEEEEAQCEVSSPMERLESFFIRTVAAAEEQAQPTSGAVGSTHISDFLAPPTSILDRLVSSNPAEEVVAGGAESTEEASVAETPQEKADEQLLRKLTETIQPAPSQPLVTTQPAKPPAVEEEIEKRILEQLTGGSAGEQEGTGPSDEPKGESGDA